jgi:salicylate hydroxylase
MQKKGRAHAAKHLRAAVVGAGIGGLSTACALRQRGVEVTVFEQAERLGEIGAGLVIFPNALRQLERMGLGEALASAGAKIGERSEYYRADGGTVGPMVTTDSSGWNGVYGMHRADLLNVLAASLPPSTIRAGHCCCGFKQSATVARLRFTNGETAEADFVIAADGIHSALQKYIVDQMPPEYSGVRAYRGLIARERLAGWREEAQQLWMGEGKHFIVYPVRSGLLLNYVAFVPSLNATTESWSAAGDRDELVSSFNGWDPRVVELLKAVDKCFWWGLYDRRPLQSWTKGRLALLGDAAHAMLPHLGQGANQAIEDGVALAVLVEEQISDDLPRILRHYEQIRRARTDNIQREARKSGLRYDSQYSDLDQRDRELASLATFRKSLFDYDVEEVAIAHRKEYLPSR